MTIKNTPQKCSLVLLADGFDEIEAVVILSTLRRAGLCVKSVGLTGGLLRGVHGISLLPDVTLTELGRMVDMASIELVVLPGSERSLAKLEPDPRAHRLLHQVLMQQGLIATSTQGVRMLKMAAGLRDGGEPGKDAQVILYYPMEHSIAQFAQDLVRRLSRPAHV